MRHSSQSPDKVLSLTKSQSELQRMQSNHLEFTTCEDMPSSIYFFIELGIYFPPYPNPDGWTLKRVQLMA